MVYCAGDSRFSDVMEGDDYHDHMNKYVLISDNVSSLKEKISREDLPEDKRKCYRFHLKNLKKKQEELQRIIEL